MGRQGGAGNSPPAHQAGHDANRKDFRTGYADMAIASFAVFDRMQKDGVIPEGVKFQISIPTPIAPNLQQYDAGRSSEAAARAHPTFIGEVHAIAAALPNDRIAIQWDVCQEVLAWEGYYEPGRSISAPNVSMSWVRSVTRCEQSRSRLSPLLRQSR